MIPLEAYEFNKIIVAAEKSFKDNVPSEIKARLSESAKQSYLLGYVHALTR